MVFLKVDKKNTCQLKLILDEFSTLSRLNINMPKSTIYFGGHVKDRQWITSHLGLSTRDLQVRYLFFCKAKRRETLKYIKKEKEIVQGESCFGPKDT